MTSEEIMLAKVPQNLYNSEINFVITTFWDGGFMAKLGDEMNGFVAEKSVPTYMDALRWLDEEARKRFPESLYVTGKYPSGWRFDGGVSAQG